LIFKSNNDIVTFTEKGYYSANFLKTEFINPLFKERRINE